jgi:hypothetical protein
MLERAGLMIFGLVVILFGVKTFVSSSTVKKGHDYMDKAANGGNLKAGSGEGLAAEAEAVAPELAVAA